MTQTDLLTPNNSSPRIPTHDNLKSGTNTPSGVITPHPDLSDKRFPHILSSYLGQVRESDLSTSLPSTPCTPQAHVKESSQPPHLKTISSPSERRSDIQTISPLSPVTPKTMELVTPSTLQEQFSFKNFAVSHDFPTPPLSSNSSLHLKSPRSDSGDEHQCTGRAVQSGTRSPPRIASVSDMLPLNMRRHTLSSKPVTSVTTAHTTHSSRTS